MRVLSDYLATLDLAIPRLVQDENQLRSVSVPAPATHVHSKLHEASQYDLQGIQELQNYYTGFMATGAPDRVVLDHANDQLLKGAMAAKVAQTELRALAGGTWTIK